MRKKVQLIGSLIVSCFLTMEQLGEIMDLFLSSKHVPDIKMIKQLVRGFTAKLYTERDYIGHEFKEKLKNYDIDLNTYYCK